MERRNGREKMPSKPGPIRKRSQLRAVSEGQYLTLALQQTGEPSNFLARTDMKRFTMSALAAGDSTQHIPNVVVPFNSLPLNFRLAIFVQSHGIRCILSIVCKPSKLHKLIVSKDTIANQGGRSIYPVHLFLYNNNYRRE